jgi:hypothetical protein
MRCRFELPVSLYYRLKVWKAVRQIVSEVSEGVWPDVMRKRPGCSTRELNEYARVRAGQLVHPRVDALLKLNPSINGVLGDRLLAIASSRVEKLIQGKLARQTATARSRRVA